MHTNFLFQNSDGRDHIGGLGTDGKTIFDTLRTGEADLRF